MRTLDEGRRGGWDKTYTNWVKKTENGTVAKLVEEFNRELDAIAIHHFNWLHQAQKFRQLKDNLRETELVLHVDFSENDAGKLNTEIQSFHFGGNRQQASIHTVVAYTSTGSQSYATISDSLSHNVGPYQTCNTGNDAKLGPKD
ncbi:Ufm1-specific protease [Dissostichus eleginoides]|uniref:Ufm1-specific protease n=1 Tax=Dissostichus eleginoides TaxID=100907 RepID=A0AAD9CN19_DISEL|nr:Ufm1-specific protease [Dissostichus eleginoides]